MQLRSEIYIPSEEKTSADGETGRFIALKEVNFTDIDISKHYYSWLLIFVPNCT